MSLNEVLAILKGYQMWRPDSVETIWYIFEAIEYNHKTGRTLNISLRDEYAI